MSEVSATLAYIENRLKLELSHQYCTQLNQMALLTYLEDHPEGAIADYSVCIVCEALLQEKRHIRIVRLEANSN